MSLSLNEYLKKYQSNTDEPKKKKKTKKIRPDTLGIQVVDEDPEWQKPVKLDEEDEADSADEGKPQIDVDVEVKRMKRLEQLRLKRPYLGVSEDGSGWVSITDTSTDLSSRQKVHDISPVRPTRNNPHVLPSKGQVAHSTSNESLDLSPPHRRHRSPDSHSPECPDQEFFPQNPRPRRVDTPSPEPDSRPLNSIDQVDLSPPRRRRADTSSPEPESRPSRNEQNLSRPRRMLEKGDTPSRPQYGDSKSVGADLDLSPPRRSGPRVHSPDLSPPRRVAHVSTTADLSPPRKTKKASSSSRDVKRAGLFSKEEIKKEIEKQKREEKTMFSKMDPAISGRGAEAVFRDKEGKRISKEELLKVQPVEEKPKEKKLEWGKGLAQKREAETKVHELELEKEKPFARTRDDPELDKMLKERIRWGDPMAHLMKRKNPEFFLEDLGADDKMKESGFMIPQTIPSHSWLKRGIDPPSNRYGIRPGRHWDGVDRSTGYEKELFKRQNEKRATEREAYLWSVSEM